jgi:membrane protein DedA with SNARE-associated domain
VLATLSEAVGELEGVDAFVAYLLVTVVVAAEAVFPILPGETAVVTAATFASQGDLDIFWVFVAGWLGAMGGDFIGFGIGRLGSERLTSWATRAIGERRQQKTRRLFVDHGGPVLIIGRFVPGLRLLCALTAGSTGMPLRRYVRYEVAGAALWSLYASTIGYVVGVRLEGVLWVSLLVSGVATAVVSIGVAAMWRRAGEAAEPPAVAPAVDAEA